MFREALFTVHVKNQANQPWEVTEVTLQHLKKMRIENIFHETMTMNEEHKNGHGPQDNEGLSHDKQLKFHTLLGHAGELEKEINALIAKFEQKHQVSCWISTEKHNRVSIAIAADTDQL